MLKELKNAIEDLNQAEIQNPGLDSGIHNNAAFGEFHRCVLSLGERIGIQSFQWNNQEAWTSQYTPSIVRDTPLAGHYRIQLTVRGRRDQPEKWYVPSDFSLELSMGETEKSRNPFEASSSSSSSSSSWSSSSSSTLAEL